MTYPDLHTAVIKRDDGFVTMFARRVISGFKQLTRGVINFSL